MPLPCSPVSYSTASESQSLPATSEDESDVSLTTPRPGPADPAQRTRENLSTPSVPGFSSSSAASLDTAIRGVDSGTSDTTLTQRAQSQGAGTPSSSSPTGLFSDPVTVPERIRSVTFLRHPAGTSPKRRSIYTGQGGAMSGISPTISPRGEARVPLNDEAESSADENTAIFKRQNAAARQYGAVLADQQQATDTLAGSSTAKKRTSVAKGKDVQTTSNDAQDAKDEAAESWWKKTLVKYGSVELENKGSVARDHLALERTFLAWLRTSLSFASIGIAVTQLFRLNTNLASPDDGSNPGGDPAAHLKQLGKPLGATFLGISILILLLGFHRYFESQHYVIRGKFPASRGSIVLVSFVAGGLIVASLAVVLAIAPNAFET